MSKALATKNVAAVLVGAALIFGFAFSFAKPANADTLSDLQAQVQALLAQIASLQSAAGSTSNSGGGACFTFTQNLTMGSTGSEVMQLQKYLNNHGYTVAATGAGSPGNETSYFGGLTKAAVVQWQNANATSVLTPVGLVNGTGYWGPSSRAYANSSCTSTGTGTGTGTGTPTGSGLVVTAGTQPANTLAPASASRVPFTTFTLTNSSGAAVTVNGITIQRVGLANDNVFAGVVLVDSNGVQLGNSQTFNSNHQAVIGGTFTLQAGQSMTYTVAGNMQNTSTLSSYTGQVAGISVVGVNTSVPVSGSLPITGASQTINSTLSIGTATVGLSGYDPNSHRSESIGTTGLTFSAIRITAGSAEDEKLYSITWNQTGSVGSTDIGNLVTVVNGQSYPVTVDSTGKYYTSTFPGGILVTKGNSVDAYIKGDLVGSNSTNRTVEFDVYRASDIYMVGQTYGYGVTPTTTTSGTNTSGANTSSGFSSTSNPFYFGTYTSITGGQLSTVSTASSVAPQNIAVNVPNQTLGGFSTNFTGEPVTVQSVIVDVATTTGATQLQNVTLVDQNGNVVAGPVDMNNTGTKKITFNTTVTFPTGAMTYTIKGTVKTGATDGSTYTLSTNPSTEWTSAVGQTSGSSLTLTNTTITMSTMTVRAGKLTISASASPAATAITTNQNNFTVANIVLDASQSGENVRLNALPVMVSATSSTDATDLKSNLTNCQLFDSNGNALNSQSVGASQWTTKTDLNGLSANGIEANFTFTNSLQIAKGTTVTLALKCNVGGSLYSGEQFAGGVDSTYAPTVTGATSGNTITTGSGNLVVTNGTSGTMTVGTASIAVTTPNPLTFTQVPGDSTGITVGRFTLQPSSGDVSLQNIGLKLNSNYASSSDIANGVVTIYNGSSVVGTANFNGKSPTSGYYYATSTITNLNLPQNQQTELTLKVDTAGIGTGMSGTSGHEILVGLSDANGTSGNTQVDSAAATQPTTSQGVALFRSFPSQVSLVSIPATGNNDGRLIQFSVTANSKHAIGVDQFVFTIASSTGVTITNPALYYCSGSSCSPNTEVLNGGSNATSYTANGAYATTTIATPLQVGKGQTWNFLLKASTLSYSGSNSTYSITTTLKGDSTNLAPSTIAGATATSTYNFVWSPNSTTTSSGSSNDWSNGYGVSGLPSYGISQARSN